MCKIILDKFYCSNKNHYKLSRGETCVANFIHPANGASQGKYFE